MSKRYIVIWVILFLFACLFDNGYTQQIDEQWPDRVLITNDNGIEDPKIIRLAEIFAPLAETYLVTSKGDRSGSTHYMSAVKTGKIEAEKQDVGNNIKAWAIDGYPADAVLLALKGIMKNTPPDLVVSGINGGPNLAHDWIGSGTIGAARLAAFVGIPAIAVSGVHDESTGSEELEAAVQWVLRLAESELVQNLEKGQYLTVSFPGIHPSEIKGVKVAERAGVLIDFDLEVMKETDNFQTWSIGLEAMWGQAEDNTDAALHQQGYIVVVPMRADEHDYKLLEKLKKDQRMLPAFESGK